MASSGPASLDISGSADEKFRLLAKRMAGEINGFSAGRQKGMQAPPQHSVVKTRIRFLIADKPAGYFDSAGNRGAFWEEIDQMLGSVKPLGTGWHKEWLRAITEVITEYRTFATELLNGACAETERAGKSPETQKWEDFKGFLQNSSQTLNQSESPELSQFYQNMVALTDSVIGLYSTPKDGVVLEKGVENFICEMLQAFEYLRTSDHIGQKKGAYESCLAVLKHMIEKEPVPEYLKEFLEHETGEFKFLIEHSPDEEAPLTLVSKPVTEVHEAQKQDIDPSELLAWADELSEESRGETEFVEKPQFYGPIHRWDKPAQKEEVRKLAEEFSKAIDEAEDPDRIRQLFRHNVHEFMDAMTEVIADLIQRGNRSVLGEQLTDYLQRSRKGAFVTFIADAVINKIGKPTLRIAQRCDSDEDFYENLQAETNHFDETGFESAALLTLCAIIGCKGGDMFAILRKDWNAKEKIWREMSQIDARSFAESGEEEDLKEGSDHDFVLSEANWLIKCLEHGCDPAIEGDEFDEETEAAAEAETAAVFELSQVPDKVIKLAAKLENLEGRHCQITENKEGLMARMADLDEEILAEQNLEKLKVLEGELKAKMPEFESEAFSAWTEEGIVLGERKRILQDKITMLKQEAVSREELEDQKLCLEEDLAAEEYDLKEVAAAIGLIQEKLRKIGKIAFDNE